MTEDELDLEMRRQIRRGAVVIIGCSLPLIALFVTFAVVGGPSVALFAEIAMFVVMALVGVDVIARSPRPRPVVVDGVVEIGFGRLPGVGGTAFGVLLVFVTAVQLGEPGAPRGPSGAVAVAGPACRCAGRRLVRHVAGGAGAGPRRSRGRGVGPSPLLGRACPGGVGRRRGDRHPRGGPRSGVADAAGGGPGVGRRGEGGHHVRRADGVGADRVARALPAASGGPVGAGRCSGGRAPGGDRGAAGHQVTMAAVVPAPTP